MKIKKIKFFKKLFAVFIAFLFLSSSLLITNAQTITSGVTNITCKNNSQYSFDITDVSFIVTRSGHSYDGGSLTVTDVSEGVSIRLNLNSDAGDITAGDVVTVLVTLSPKEYPLTNTQMNVVGSMCASIKNDAGVIERADVLGYRTDESSDFSQDAAITNWDSGWGDYWKFTFNQSSINYFFNEYVIGLEWEIPSKEYVNSYNNRLYLSDFEFDVMSKEDYQTEKITQNQNQNTDRIIENENNNFDELINGGTDYEEVDKGAVNNYINAENELNNGLTESKEVTSNFLGNFGANLINTKVQRGLLFVSALFKEFFGINWMSNILTFSLALGVFAFVIGSTLLILKMSKK